MTDDEASRRPGPVPPPPAPSTPGMIPGAQPPVQAGFGGEGAPPDPVAAGLDRPTGLAKALIGVTGAFTVLMAVTAVYARDDVTRLTDALGTGETPSGASTVISIFILPLLLMTYFLYGMWMSRIRMNREALHQRVGLTAIEWWGWLVPLASVVLVPWGARRVTGRAAPLWSILGWWIAWQGATMSYAVANAAIVGSLDLDTVEVVRPEMLDLSVTYIWASAALTAVSWVFLVVFIRRATARHLEA